MRTFIRYNSAGEIVSVCRTEFISPYMATPFGDIGPGEGVMEVTDRRGLADLKTEEIHDSYRVAVGTGKLVRKR